MEDLYVLNKIINEDVDEAVAELAIARDVLAQTDAFALSDRKFVQIFRVNKALCAAIIDIVTPFIVQPTRASALSIQTKVFASLRFYASGSYQEVTATNSFVAISQPSISRVINEVTNALNQPEILNRIIRFPRNIVELQTLRTRFYDKYQFPGVIGCIDCTHVSIVSPPVNDEHFPEHIYVNRKHYHSLNVQLICDNNLRILNVISRFPSATHDSHIWLRHLERQFNDRLCSIRSTIERCNGVPKNRFRCLLKYRTLHYHPTAAAKIVNACCVLHNLCVDRDIPEVNVPHIQEPDYGMYNIPNVIENMPRNVINPDLTAARNLQQNIIANHFN